MNSTNLGDGLRDRAVALRRAGRSRREIKQMLGIGSNATLNEVLAGEPPPAWTRRPRAKDDLRARARELRADGHDYAHIAAELGVSKSSVSLWVRDLPWPERLSYEESRKRSAEGARRYWEAERPRREAGREAIRAAAAADIGELTPRDVLIAGAVAYWCEGAKSKPYRRQSRVIFTNSDPGLIEMFLRFLRGAGIASSELTFSIQIHENADVAEAHRFWREVTGAGPQQFRKATLKHHNPKTARRNTGEGYHGCLRVEVRRSAVLYARIEGWSEMIMGRVRDPPSATGQEPNQGLWLPGEDSNLG